MQALVEPQVHHGTLPVYEEDPELLRAVEDELKLELKQQNNDVHNAGTLADFGDGGVRFLEAATAYCRRLLAVPHSFGTNW